VDILSKVSLRKQYLLKYELSKTLELKITVVAFLLCAAAMVSAALW
jgi:hypothetical protein